MIQKGSKILYALIVIAVMITGYGLKQQLDENRYAIELSTETNNPADSFLSDSDGQEDQNSNHFSQIFCITENLSTSFTIQNPSVLKFHCYTIWQPPKTC